MINKKIALLGQPNSGKSTIFNALTGSHQHVGNWPGKTVEKAEGYFIHKDVKYTLADLPGSYSLSANSDEEIVTRDYIASGDADLICILADASQLERSLFMLADFAGINTPVMLVLTMIDVAEQKNKKINIKKLSENLGIPVASVVAPDKKEYDNFFETLEKAIASPKKLDCKAINKIYSQNLEDTLFDRALAVVPNKDLEQYSPEWLAIKLIEGDENVCKKLPDTSKAEKFMESVEKGNLYTSSCKFEWIDEILKGAVSKTSEQSQVLTNFDKKAISKRWGKLIAIGIILLGLVGSMIIAMPIMGLGGVIPSLLSPPVESGLVAINAPAWLISLICNTLITAIGWTLSMLGFVFGINLVFGLIEEVGYMARVSYVFDDVMGKLGLQGKSVMPILVGFGCTIGGAAGTRVIDSWGQRLLTIAVVWAVPCGAIFAVIPTIASAFFGWGGILVMVAIILVMLLHIVITAKIFGRKLAPKSERVGLIMELPPYHKPRWGYILKHTCSQVVGVIKKAFVVVVAIAALFWVASYSFSGEGPESTILYKIGTFIEPFTKIIGLSWQSFMAFVASMVSKEAILGVLSALFVGSNTLFDSAMTGAASDANLMQVITSTISKPEALALIFSVTFNVPCTMAVASTYQETHSLKWTLKIMGYYILSAMLIAFVVYHIANIFC